MKVKELIELLSKLDGENEIRYENVDYESGETAYSISNIVDAKELRKDYFAHGDDERNFYLIR